MLIIGTNRRSGMSVSSSKDSVNRHIPRSLMPGLCAVLTLRSFEIELHVCYHCGPGVQE